MAPVCNIEPEIDAALALKKKYKNTEHEVCAEEFFLVCIQLVEKALIKLNRSRIETEAQATIMKNNDDLRKELNIVSGSGWKKQNELCKGCEFCDSPNSPNSATISQKLVGLPPRGKDGAQIKKRSLTTL